MNLSERDRAPAEARPLPRADRDDASWALRLTAAVALRSRFSYGASSFRAVPSAARLGNGAMLACTVGRARKKADPAAIPATMAPPTASKKKWLPVATTTSSRNGEAAQVALAHPPPGRARRETRWRVTCSSRRLPTPAAV